MNNHPLITESVSWFDRWKSIKVDFFHSRIATQLVFDINIGQLPGSDLEVDKGPIPIPNTSTLCPKKHVTTFSAITLTMGVRLQ